MKKKQTRFLFLLTPLITLPLNLCCVYYFTRLDMAPVLKYSGTLFGLCILLMAEEMLINYGCFVLHNRKTMFCIKWHLAIELLSIPIFAVGAWLAWRQRNNLEEWGFHFQILGVALGCMITEYIKESAKEKTKANCPAYVEDDENCLENLSVKNQAELIDANYFFPFACSLLLAGVCLLLAGLIPNVGFGFLGGAMGCLLIGILFILYWEALPNLVILFRGEFETKYDWILWKILEKSWIVILGYFIISSTYYMME